MTGARTTGLGTAIGTAVGAAGTLGLGALVARRLVMPTPYRATATVRSATDGEVELAATRDTRLPGTYDLRREDARVRVTDVLADADDVVRRRADRRADTGLWTWDALLHDDLDDVPGTEPAAGGETDARAEPSAGADTHVVHVHGQSLGPRQVLRGVGVWRTLGATSEVVDTSDLPLRSLDAAAADRIEQAVRAARARGVRRVVLQGWSAGALACSVVAARVPVDGIVAVSPLLDVAAALRGAVRAARLPSFVGSAAARIATTPVLCRLAGAPVPVPATTWQESATPLLLVHSTADALVPEAEVTRQHAARVVTFRTAPHTLEWNEDPQRWESAVRDFAQTLR